MPKRLLPRVQPLFLKWFRENRRDLPWRKTSHPYPVWISEIMLQQTQVNTVIPYYNRWMKNFPTVQSLARAPLSKVLKAWEGLGYYSRARNLHLAAKIIVEKRRGKFPGSAQDWQDLPGIGRYTAGAITSIAFDQPEPLLDGNVMRVLSRLLAFKNPIDQTQGREALWQVAKQLIEGVAPGSRGDFNQSLMELGAVVCLPENPRCDICPVQKMCAAHKIKKETDFPVKTRKQKLEKLRTVAAVIWKKNRILLEKRPLDARWGGLWAFPHWTFQNEEKELEFLTKRVREDLGIEIKDWRNHCEIRHGFTKYNVRLRVYEGRCTVDETPPLHVWAFPKKLAALPLPRPHQKIAELIQSHA